MTVGSTRTLRELDDLDVVLVAGLYPAASRDLDRMVVVGGPFVIVNAAFAHIDLALAIVRSVSVDLAQHVARLLLIDVRPSQASFIAYDHIAHGDQRVG